MSISGVRVSPRPKISVILPAYNAEIYLREAVQSVLDQSFTDFELIILNDGSTDGTAELLESFDDARIRIIHQENIGLALTLNKGISLSRGEFIARQDADDISLPERFARQIDYLVSHKSCGLLGTGSIILDDRQLTTRRHQHPTSNGKLQMNLLFDSFFVHSSVMLRRSALDEVGVYPTDPERNPPEDFDLWLRLARKFEVANLSEPLVMYREVPGSISRSKAELLNRRAITLSSENLCILFGSAQPDLCMKDLAALLRYTPQYMSVCPDWTGMLSTLRKARDCLIRQWPNDSSDIDLAARDLILRLHQGRLRSSWFGKSVLQVRSIFRRFIKTCL